MSGLVRLDPESVRAVALEVVALLREAQAAVDTPVLLTAGEVAARFGVSRPWVYEHAEELGVIRLGDGVKPRVRFDAERVAEVLRARSAGDESSVPGSPGAARVRGTGGVGLVPNGRGSVPELEGLPESWRRAVESAAGGAAPPGLESATHPTPSAAPGLRRAL